MKKTLQYFIVEHWEVDQFYKDVANYEYDGWALHGGLVVYMDLHNKQPMYCQAFIKYV